MTGEHARFLAIGNPRARSSPFFHCFAGGGDWNTIHVSSHQAAALGIGGMATTTSIEERRRLWGEDSALWLAMVEGEFPDASDYGLIPASWVHAARSRRHRSTIADAQGRAVVGLDIADAGGDETVWLVRRGRTITRIERLRYTGVQLSTMETAGRTIHILEEEGIRARDCFLDIGASGKGVYDRLREQGHYVTGVNFGEAADESERFVNKRAEMYWRIRDFLAPPEDAAENSAVIPADDALEADLLAQEYEVRSNGKLKIVDKKIIRQRLGRSPDAGDALALTFADMRGTADLSASWGSDDDIEADTAAYAVALGEPAQPLHEPGVNARKGRNYRGRERETDAAG